MQLRCVFVTDKKNIVVPEGWSIYKTEIVTPPKGKPCYMTLLTKEKVPIEPGTIGYKVSTAKHLKKRKRVLQ